MSAGMVLGGVHGEVERIVAAAKSFRDFAEADVQVELVSWI
jgi:hypothetical protein